MKTVNIKVPVMEYAAVPYYYPWYGYYAYPWYPYYSYVYPW